MSEIKDFEIEMFNLKLAIENTKVEFRTLSENFLPETSFYQTLKTYLMIMKSEVFGMKKRRNTTLV